MWNSMRSRRESGTGVVAGSGTPDGSFSRSAASSQPGTREPCPKRGTLVGSIAISGSSRAYLRGGPLAVDPPEDGVEHRQRGDEVGDVGVAHHRRGRLEVDEARVAHVHASGLARAVGAHEAA